MRILIIEDEPDLAANIWDYLEDRGHTMDRAGDGITGLHLAVTKDYDVIVLDLSLPGLDGLEVCHKLRTEAGKTTPVLMLTARDRLEDKLEGFKKGTDDYLVKPFDWPELEVRLEALVRRGGKLGGKVLQVGDLKYNLDAGTVTRGETDIELNPISMKLLRCLMEASPNLVSGETLKEKLWGEEPPESDSLRVHIHSLRAAIDKPFGSEMIQTKHKMGYRLVAPDAV